MDICGDMHLGFEVSAALCCLAFISSFLSFLFFLLFVDALLLHGHLSIRKVRCSTL